MRGISERKPSIKSNKSSRHLKIVKRVLGILPPEKFPPERSTQGIFPSMLLRLVARFARVRIENSSRNRFALNGIQRIACFTFFFCITRKIKIGKSEIWFFFLFSRVQIFHDFYFSSY